MKKIIAGVVLALGLVGAANANTYTYYVCNSYFEYKGDDTRYLSDGDRYYHAPSGKYRGFIGVKIRVNDDNSQFAFNDPVFDKTIKSPKLKEDKNEKEEYYGSEDGKSYIKYLHSVDGAPIFDVKKGDTSYSLISCREIL
ncbi:TPA: hypothetical protein ACYEPA_003796 [Escherichia coli]